MALFPNPALLWSGSRLLVYQCAHENSCPGTANKSAAMVDQPLSRIGHYPPWLWNYTSINAAVSLLIAFHHTIELLTHIRTLA